MGTGKRHVMSRAASLHNFRNCRHGTVHMNGGQWTAAIHVNFGAESYEIVDIQPL